MRIINVMTSRMMGGIERAFLDYNSVLSAGGHKVLAVYHRDAIIKNFIQTSDNVELLPTPFTKRNIFQIPHLYSRLKKFSPDIIICQTKRSLFIFKILAKMLGVPIVAVAHNARIKRIRKCSAIFSITKTQRQSFIDKGYPVEKIFYIPNMLTTKKAYQEFSAPPPPRESTFFGTLSRLASEKGLPDFIKAIKICRDQGFDFKAKISGSYTDDRHRAYYHTLQNLVNNYGLQDAIEFIGWVDDKDKFFTSIDVFVSSSYFETFNISLIEAMIRSKPIISSFVDIGPKEILANGGGYFYNAGDAEDLADKMIKIVTDVARTKNMVKDAYRIAQAEYTAEAVLPNINKALNIIVEHNKKG